MAALQPAENKTGRPRRGAPTKPLSLRQGGRRAGREGLGSEGLPGHALQVFPPLLVLLLLRLRTGQADLHGRGVADPPVEGAGAIQQLGGLAELAALAVELEEAVQQAGLLQ